MKHIFGMAKSSLDLRGAKAQKLELDFLRLAYAVDHYRRCGEEAQGYLLVLGPELQTRVAAWTRKYGAADSVRCICHSVTTAEHAALALEKTANVAGMIAGARGEGAGSQSDANVGHELGEAALQKVIRAAEPDVEERTVARDLPFGIRWDFYGLVRSQSDHVA
jgi:hypothetical protein